MKYQLMKLSELGFLLDYEDTRSIEGWCQKNKIPIMTAGRQKYVPTFFVDLYFQNYVTKFVTANYTNPEAIMNAIDTNDSIKLSELLEAPTDPIVKSEYKKKEHSKVTQQFLSNIQTA